MAERFELDESDVREAGERAQTAARRLLDAHRELVAVLNDREGCWGDDDIGKAFEKTYLAPVQGSDLGFADVTRENTEMLGVNLRDVGEFIETIAGELADVDASNAREIDRVYADNVESWTEGS